MSIYRVKITERANIINFQTKRVHDDVGLRALDGIQETVVEVEASSPDEAKYTAGDSYQFEFCDSSVVLEVVE